MFDYDVIQRFNDTEMMIYKFIMSHREQISYMSVRKLAQELHVSASTILRFCEKAGCDGYSDFKEQLSSYFTGIEEKPPQKDLKEILRYFEGVNTEAFERKIEEGANLLRESEKVIFIGTGTSGILGRYGARYLSNFGIFSLSIEDSFYPVFRDLYNKTTVIVLSVSGESESLIELTERFRQHKCKIMSITNDMHCTIAKIADWNICYPIRAEKIGINDVTSQIPVIFLIETLARRV